MELLLSIHVLEVKYLFWQFRQLSKSMLLCYATHIPEICSSASLLLLHACCSSVLLLCCCSAAQVQLVWLCNHWVRLHCCTLPVLLLKCGLGWVGLGWRVSMAWGSWKYLEYSINPLIFLPCLKEKMMFIRITVQVCGESKVNLLIHGEKSSM